MATLSEEFVYTVPADVVRSSSTGLSIDFGMYTANGIFQDIQPVVSRCLENIFANVLLSKDEFATRLSHI